MDALNAAKSIFHSPTCHPLEICEHCTHILVFENTVREWKEFVMSSSPTGYARNRNVEIAFEDLGGSPGIPLLLVMGSSVTRFWWPPGFIQELIECGFHVVSFDNRDSGQSTHFPQVRATPITALFQHRNAAYTAEDMADDAAAVMDAMGWESAHLFGHSNGGLNAQRIALRHPQRVLSIATSAAISSDAGRLKLLQYIKFGFVARMARLRFPETPEGDVSMSLAVSRALASPGFPFDEEEALYRIQRDEIGSVSDPNTMGRQLGVTWNGGRLAQLQIPTLVLHGDSDQLLRVAAAHDLAKSIPNAQLHITAGLGHDLPREVWPIYAAKILDNAKRAN